MLKPYFKLKLKKCSNQELKDLRKYIYSILDMPLIDEINKVIKCLEQFDDFEHCNTHEQFQKQQYKIIKDKLKEDTEDTKKIKALFKKNSILIEFFNQIEFWLKILKLSINFYKVNEWDIEDTYIRKPALELYQYSNSLFDVIYNEEKQREKQND